MIFDILYSILKTIELIWIFNLGSIQKVKTVKCIKLSQSEMSEIFFSKLVWRTQRGEEFLLATNGGFFAWNFTPKLVLYSHWQTFPKYVFLIVTIFSILCGGKLSRSFITLIITSPNWGFNYTARCAENGNSRQFFWIKLMKLN